MTNPSFSVVDLTREVDDGIARARTPGGLAVFAVHRIWLPNTPLDAAVSPEEICELLMHVPETGGELAYAALFAPDGRIWQVLPLYELGAHARKWNPVAAGLAVMGDPRSKPLTRPQYNALVDFCAEALPAIGRMPQEQVHYRGFTVHALSGHDELPDSSNDETKECPGRYLPMAQLREDVAAAIAAGAQQRLIAAGVRP